MSIFTKKPAKVQYDLHDDPIPPLHPVLKALKWIMYGVIALVFIVLAVRLVMFGDSSSSKIVYLLPGSSAAYNAGPSGFEIYSYKSDDTMSADGLFQCKYIYYVPSAGQLEALIKYRTSLTSAAQPYPYRIYLLDNSGAKVQQAQLLAAGTHFNYYELRYSFTGVTLDPDPDKRASYTIEIRQVQPDGSESAAASFSLAPQASIMELYHGAKVKFASPISTDAAETEITAPAS